MIRYGQGTCYAHEKWEPICTATDPDTPKEQAMRFNDSKLRVDLIPPEAIYALAVVLSYGAVKYDDKNWEKFDTIENPDSYFGGSQGRHILYALLGRPMDPESGLPDNWHTLTNAAMRVTYDARTAVPDEKKRLEWFERLFEDAVIRAKKLREERLAKEKGHD